MEGHVLWLKGSHAFWIIDGKPLIVGCYSKDQDAAWGRAGSGYAKGYKLHAVYGATSLPTTWDVAPLNIHGVEGAMRLLSLHGQRGCLLGDKAYDSNRLHDLANKVGIQLLVPKQRGAKLGHCRHAPGRLRCLEILDEATTSAVRQLRNQIERNFGWLTNHAGGLSPLPASVRRA